MDWGEVVTQKEIFIENVKFNISRNGVTEILSALEKTDFYTAPASTKYHGAYEGGLVEHSNNVFTALKRIVPAGYDIEQLAIISLFHDLCKINFYKVEYRNTKDERGQWIKVPYYTVEDRFPYGHGEKSSYLISEHIKLTPEEALAIRWHMAGFAPKDEHNTVSSAFEYTPLAVYIHMADLEATYLMGEKK